MIVDGIEQLDVPGAERRLAEGWRLLDVRETDEHAQARIPGALFIPLSQLERRHGELPREPLLVYCAGGARSHSAAKFLQGKGLQVANLAHGIHGWYRMGRPVDTGPA